MRAKDRVKGESGSEGIREVVEVVGVEEVVEVVGVVVVVRECQARDGVRGKGSVGGQIHRNSHLQ